VSGWKFVRRGAVMTTLLALLSPAGIGAAELDPAAVVFKLPDQLSARPVTCARRRPYAGRSQSP
jgi:hypothetical protein